MRWVLLACALLVACAQTENLGLRPITPLPTGATEHTVVVHDRTKLAQLVWLPAGRPRASVVIVHGLRDHAARYAGFARRLVAAGYAVYATDLRGHAHSAGPRAAPTAWHDYVTDLDEEIAAVPRGHPVFVFGHSMGGAIATVWAIEHPQHAIAGLVLSAPALAIDSVPLLIAATRLFATLTPHASALDLPSVDLSTDPAIVREIRTDPMVMQTAAPARTAAGLVEGIRAIWAGAHELRVPLLALHGSSDKITAPEGSRALVRAAASQDKTLRIYDRFVHDLLHEPRGARVVDDIVAWLDAHTGGTAVTAPPVFTGRLRGDPGEWTQAISASGGLVHGDAGTNFAALATLHLGKMRPLGWSGGLTGYLLGDGRSLSIRPLGLAVRTGGAAIGLSGGGALSTGLHFSTSFATFVELPVGPLHVSLLAERERRIANTHAHGPLASDQLLAALSLRFGRDRGYWPGVVAGVGPVVTSGLSWFADASATWFVTFGVQLYGVD